MRAPLSHGKFPPPFFAFRSIYNIHDKISITEDERTMTGNHRERSPLARLVLFMIFLSLAGTLVAGLHWYAIDLPVQQELIRAPDNYDPTPCDSCQYACEAAWCTVVFPHVYCKVEFNDCLDACPC